MGSANSASTKTKPEVRILCFGDSLTAGWTEQGATYRPYQIALSRSLQAAFPTLHFTLVVDGLPGDRVEPGFLPRIQKDFPPVTDKVFDWTIILGGTNDMSQGVPVEVIFDRLKEVWGVPIANGGKVLACTVMDSRVDLGWDSPRDELNAKIMGYKGDGKSLHVCDLYTSFPYRKMSSKDRAINWDDDVHPSPTGYDLMGEKIAESLGALISSD